MWVGDGVAVGARRVRVGVGVGAGCVAVGAISAGVAVGGRGVAVEETAVRVSCCRVAAIRVRLGRVGPALVAVGTAVDDVPRIDTSTSGVEPADAEGVSKRSSGWTLGQPYRQNAHPPTTSSTTAMTRPNTRLALKIKLKAFF